MVGKYVVVSFGKIAIQCYPSIEQASRELHIHSEVVRRLCESASDFSSSTSAAGNANPLQFTYSDIPLRNTDVVDSLVIRELLSRPPEAGSEDLWSQQQYRAKHGGNVPLRCYSSNGKYLNEFVDCAHVNATLGLPLSLLLLKMEQSEDGEFAVGGLTFSSLSALALADGDNALLGPDEASAMPISVIKAMIAVQQTALIRNTPTSMSRAADPLVISELTPRVCLSDSAPRTIECFSIDHVFLHRFKDINDAAAYADC